MTLAKTEAAGSTGLLPEVLTFSSSLSLDKQLLREDLLGSMAHVTMLGRQNVIPAADARVIRDGLIKLWQRADENALELPNEEDVHMAVEVELNNTIGGPAGLLHSARSRNDQVATDLRLHVRESCRQAVLSICEFVNELLKRAELEKNTIFPGYTHRQRAQPISVAYWLNSYAVAFLRDAHSFVHAMEQSDILPLGVGAISGTSLNTNREISRELLGFSALTINGLDTVGDRDFASDYMYATSKFFIHASRLATDIIDFTTSEFGFAALSGDISMGSSMMPQKKNPDLFELIRGKCGRAIGNLMGLLTTVKGLPGGYNRDLQEDRGPLLETRPLLHSSLAMLRLAMPRVAFNVEKCRAAVDEGFTQATDLAEALVKRGVPFRTSYKLVGSLVRRCQEKGMTLSQATVEMGQAIDPSLDAEALKALDAAAAVARKKSAGSTGPESVAVQFQQLSAQASALKTRAEKVPALNSLFLKIKESAL